MEVAAHVRHLGAGLRAAAVEASGTAVSHRAAQMHAATAAFVAGLAEFDDNRAWDGDGLRSCAHWLAINAGLSLHRGEELLRVSHALRSLPAIAAAFAVGELSLDKVRDLTRVAVSADEGIWLELAGQASAHQLSRICASYRRAVEADSPERAEHQARRRGLWAFWDGDGMVHLRGILPAEEGAAVIAALEHVTAVASSPANAPALPEATVRMIDPAEDPAAACRADALVRICEAAIVDGGAHADGDAASGPARRVVVHVDQRVLTGADPEGRCELENGTPLSVATARRLACDADVVTLTAHHGVPIDLGRARRVVSARLRRALSRRDRGCRFPGCAVRARHTHAHHVRHWVDGGRTDLDNLLSLCGFHHRRLHDGAYRVALVEGSARFETASGRVIALRAPHVDERAFAEPAAASSSLGTPCAAAGGAPFDLDHTVQVVAWACESARTRAGPMTA